MARRWLVPSPPAPMAPRSMWGHARRRVRPSPYPGCKRSLWLERASRPVVTPAFAAALGAELWRDDALFEAALVSFGSFGILHGLLIETEPLFLLEAYRQRLRLTDPLWQAISTLTFDVPEFPHPGERPYHSRLSSIRTTWPVGSL